MQKVCLTLPEVLFEAGLQLLRKCGNWIHSILNVAVDFDNHIGKDVDLPTPTDLNRLRREIFITGLILIMELVFVYRALGYMRKLGTGFTLFGNKARLTDELIQESYEEPSLSEEEAHEKSSGVSEKHQTVLTTDQSATSAGVPLDMRNDETDSGKRAINLAQIPPNDLELKGLIPDCPDLLSTKQPYHCSEKSTSLSLSKIVITSYSGSKIAHETESNKLIKENLKTYYQELVESLKVDKDNVHLITGPTEQDWLQYFEQENQRKKKKRKGKKTKSNKSLKVFETSALNALNDETSKPLLHKQIQNSSYNRKSERFEKAHSGRKVKTSTIRRLKERVQMDDEFKQKCFGSEKQSEFLNPCCSFPQLGAQHRDAFVEALNKYGDDDTETLNVFGGNFNKGINYNENQGFEICSFPGLGRYESNEFPSYDHEICEEYDYFDFVEDCEVGAEEELLGRRYCTEPVQSWNCCCNF